MNSVHAADLQDRPPFADAYAGEVSHEGELDANQANHKVKAEEVIEANGLPVLPPQPGSTNDLVAQSLKGKDSIAPHAKKVDPAANMPIEAPGSWWDWMKSWWGVGSQKPAAPAEQPEGKIDASVNAANPLSPATLIPPITSDLGTESVNKERQEVAELTNRDEEMDKELKEFAKAKMDEDSPHPILLSLRQLCKQILSDKSRHLHEQFEKKKGEWAANNAEVMEVKDLLKRLMNCKDAQGGLDLRGKDEKTVQLLAKLKEHQAKTKDGSKLKDHYTSEEYTSLFNSIKEEHDDWSFKNSLVMDGLKELSQERAELHQFMIAIARADYETCSRILQRISR